METPNPKNLRKRKWIDPFQTGLVARIVCYCLIFQMAAWVFFLLADQVDFYIAAVGGEGQFFSGPFVRSLWALVLLMPPLVFEVIRFSHRLVGPLYRLRKTIQAIANGETVEFVRFRDGDMLMNVQDDFNAMLKKLQEQGLVVVQAPAKSAAPEATPSIAAAAPAHS